MTDNGNSPLKVGDLVMQYRDCCGKTSSLGKVGVLKFVQTIETMCGFCEQRNVGLHGSCVSPEGGAPLSWLKRIPPLEELQTFRQTDETTV